jgi:hypothetical protein
MEKENKNNTTYYLIDFENVGSGGLKGCDQLKKTDHIHLFYTNNANKISLDVFGQRGEAELFVHKVPVKSQSLDMHLVSYLGYLIGTCGEECEYVIISKDTDFDNIILFWQEERNVKIRRAGRIAPEKKEEKKAEKKVEKKPKKKLTSLLGKKAEPKPEPPKIEAETEQEPTVEPGPEPEKKKLTPEEKTELNNTMQKVLSKAGKPGEVIAYVTQVVVKHAGEENCKQTVYRTVIAEYGQEQGREIYNRIRKYI